MPELKILRGTRCDAANSSADAQMVLRRVFARRREAVLHIIHA